jgi:hypothetical protein
MYSSVSCPSGNFTDRASTLSFMQSLLYIYIIQNFSISLHRSFISTDFSGTPRSALIRVHIGVRMFCTVYASRNSNYLIYIRYYIYFYISTSKLRVYYLRIEDVQVCYAKLVRQYDRIVLVHYHPPNLSEGYDALSLHLLGEILVVQEGFEFYDQSLQNKPPNIYVILVFLQHNYRPFLDAPHTDEENIELLEPALLLVELLGYFLARITPYEYAQETSTDRPEYVEPRGHES